MDAIKVSIANGKRARTVGTLVLVARTIAATIWSYWGGQGYGYFYVIGRMKGFWTAGHWSAPYYLQQRRWCCSFATPRKPQTGQRRHNTFGLAKHSLGALLAWKVYASMGAATPM